VLSADLKGVMELLADRDLEEARQPLGPVLERMMDAVHGYEGTVNPVMGDGIMALLGAPIVHEDHALRACYAALALQASVQQCAADVPRTKPRGAGLASDSAALRGHCGEGSPMHGSTLFTRPCSTSMASWPSCE
jgi:class 3 adenylate cyclase